MIESGNRGYGGTIASLLHQPDDVVGKIRGLTVRKAEHLSRSSNLALDFTPRFDEFPLQFGFSKPGTDRVRTSVRTELDTVFVHLPDLIPFQGGKVRSNFTRHIDVDFSSQSI